ncbi:TolC family protein [Flammeovirga sp. MY04]|uniref:TolC family protein n=1 Tax=Flammeovirga sp. MY04 TaxID=1191459 RepID=UPI0008259D92|nr:TolC family protein [Flammeovirga sp. MY04]ANQ50921.2 TolC family protein [Flammeovirga sp. MY04]
MKKIHLLSWFLLYAFSVKSQERLSLKQAIEFALIHNYDLQIAHQDILQKHQQNTWGNAGRAPQISLSNSNRGLQQVNQPATPFSLEGQNNNLTIDASVDLRWVVFNGNKVGWQKKQLNTLENLAIISYQINAENTIESVMQQYYKVVVEKEKLILLQKVCQFSKLRVHQFQKGIELGENTYFELTREQSNWYTDSLLVLQQELNLSKAFTLLNQIIGQNLVSKKYHLTDTLDIHFMSLDEHTIKSKTLFFNSKLKEAKEQLVKNTIETEISKTERQPQILFESGYQRNLNWLKADYPIIDGGVATQTNKGHLYGGYIGVMLSLPLFNGGQINRKIQSSKIKQYQAQLGIDKQQLLLESNINQLMDEYYYHQQRLLVLQQAKTVTEDNLNLSAQQLDLGAINIFDYRQVQNATLSASINYLDAQYQMICSQINILKISGEILN